MGAGRGQDEYSRAFARSGTLCWPSPGTPMALAKGRSAEPGPEPAEPLPSAPSIPSGSLLGKGPQRRPREGAAHMHTHDTPPAVPLPSREDPPPPTSWGRCCLLGLWSLGKWKVRPLKPGLCCHLVVIAASAPVLQLYVEPKARSNACVERKVGTVLGVRGA